MVAMERIKEYSELAPEAPEFIEPRPPASWPASGKVVVEDLVIKYAEDLPPVLHKISFEVEPCSKVGIVGPTGCGSESSIRSHVVENRMDDAWGMMTAW